jgi:HAMP domain-containing protein
MGREIRTALMLTAAACLVAVLADWVVEELTSEATQASAAAPQADEAEQASVETPQADEAEQASVAAPQSDEAEQASVEVPQADIGEAEDAAEGLHSQG